MMMKRTALAAAVFFGVSAAAQAGPILIDSFDLDQEAANDPFLPAFPQSSQAGPSGSVLGGYRDMQAENNTTGFFETRLSAGGGELAFLGSAGTAGSGTLTWDGDDDPTTVDTNGLGGIDITSNSGWALDRFVFDIVSTDLPGVDIAISVFDTNGNQSVLGTALGTVTSPVSQEFLFDDFVGTADFTNVGAIQLSMSGPEALDAFFSNFQIGVDHVTALTLPPTLPLLLAGLGAYAVMRRRPIDAHRAEA